MSKEPFIFKNYPQPPEPLRYPNYDIRRSYSDDESRITIAHCHQSFTVVGRVTLGGTYFPEDREGLGEVVDEHGDIIDVTDLLDDPTHWEITLYGMLVINDKDYLFNQFAELQGVVELAKSFCTDESARLSSEWGDDNGKANR